MVRPDKNYKMSKAAKTKLALMTRNKEDRDHLKSMLIDAELSAEAARRAALKSKGAKGKDLE